jgi:hypothetical protein
LKKCEGRSVTINKNTFLKLPEGKKENTLVGKSVLPGKYKINNGRLNLKLEKKDKYLLS